MLDLLKSLGVGLTLFTVIGGLIFAAVKFIGEENLFLSLGVILVLCFAFVLGQLIRMAWEDR